MFVPDSSQNTSVAFQKAQTPPFGSPDLHAGKPTRFDIGQTRQFLPLVNGVVTALSESLPPELDRQEVVSVGTLALAQALGDYVDVGMSSFEDYARTRVEEALAREFLGAPRAEPLKVHPPCPQNEQEVDLKGCKILLVEDSPMIRKKLRFILERAGYEVFEAKSGEEAIWLAQEVVPDLILLDVVMERMDGFEVCQRLKALENFKEVPIIFVTGKTETEFIARGFDAGGSDYIGKPFNPHEALPRIRTHLKIRILSNFRAHHIDELETLNKAKDRLLRIASHDLRNPLSAIIGLSDLLGDDMSNGLNSEQSEMVETINSAAETMMDMLTDLLDMSSIESNVVALDLKPIDPEQTGHSLVNLFKVGSSQKKITLTFEKRTELAPFACDEKKIRRVLENFLSNAIKFSQPDTTVKLVLWQDESHSYFDVEDEGPGIKPCEQGLLFKEFCRTSNKPTAGEKSTGIGLSICRVIAEAHNGKVSMQNLTPKGARFRLELPRLKVDAASPVKLSGGKRHPKRDVEENHFR